MTTDNQKQLEDVRKLYRSKGVGHRLGFGTKAAVVVVDFQKQYTRTWRAKSLTPVENTATLLAAARSAGAPVAYTFIGFEKDGADAGVFGEKASTLLENVIGTEPAEIDELITPQPGDAVIAKQVPSSFFGNTLAQDLKAQGVDTVVVVGTSTSGCVRATVVDSLSHNFRTMLVRDCVMDSNQLAHDITLTDVDIKYGDVIGLDEAVAYFEGKSL